MEGTPTKGRQYVPGDGIDLEISVRHRANLKWIGVRFRHESDGSAELVASAKPRHPDTLAEPFERQTFPDGFKESKYRLAGYVPPEAPAGLYRLRGVSAETAKGTPAKWSGTEWLGPMAYAVVEVLDEGSDDTDILRLRFLD